jgi:ParB family transcriptional regulator, chromosome partitioning protein
MTTRKPALGRGLSALLPTREEGVLAGAGREAAIDLLHASPLQPRMDFEKGALEELARSIKERGIVQPIIVAPDGEGYVILAGERRWRAARAAGLSRVPVVVRAVASDAERLEIALIENLQREDLNPIEAARAYARLREEFHLTQEQIAERVGKDRASVANALRILKLPAPVREKIQKGELSAGHAKALLTLGSADDQERLAAEILRRGLSVRQTEKRAAAMAGIAPRVRTAARRDPFTRDAEERLSRRLRTRVRIHRRKRGGRLEIDYGSEEELMRLFDELMGKHK